MAVRTIATDLKLTGEKEFNDQMKAVNSNLKTLRSDMAAVSAEFDDNAGSVDALAAKNKILQDTVDQQKAKVDALRAMYEKVSAAYGENSAQADKWKQQLNNATAALAKDTAALEKNSAALKKAQKDSSTYTPVTTRLANTVKKAGEVVKSFGAKISDAAHHTPVLGEALDIAKVSAKGFAAAAKGAAVAAKGIGTVAGGVAKGVGGMAKGIGLITTASMAATALVGAGGVLALKTMVGFAKEAADAAKQAKEAGNKLTDTQKQWLEFSNQLDTLDASVANAKSALGGILLPMLGELSTEGAQFLNDFAADMNAASGDTAKQGKIMADYIAKGAQLIKEKLPEYVSVGKDLLSGLAGGLAEEGPELLDMGLDLIMELLDTIIENAPAFADMGMKLVTTLIQGLIERGPDLLTQAVEMVTQIVMGLAQAAPDLIPAAAQLVTQLLTALISAAPDLLMAGLELVYGIVSGIVDNLGEILNAADSIIQTIKDSFGEKIDDFLSLGENIVKGIWNGISQATEWIYDKISGWVGDVVQWIKDKLEIGSPSRVMADEVGFWMARGVGSGFEKEMQKVNKAIGASINTSFDIPEFAVSGPRVYRGRNYTTSSGKVVNLYFTAKTITEADINMVVDIVNRKLGDDL